MFQEKTKQLPNFKPYLEFENGGYYTYVEPLVSDVAMLYIGFDLSLGGEWYGLRRYIPAIEDKFIQSKINQMNTDLVFNLMGKRIDD